MDIRIRIRYREESSCPSSRGWFANCALRRQRPAGGPPPQPSLERGSLRQGESADCPKAMPVSSPTWLSTLQSPGRSPPSSRWGEMKRAYTRQTLESSVGCPPPQRRLAARLLPLGGSECDSAGSCDPVGGHAHQPFLEGEQWCRSRLIEVGEIGEAMPGLVRAGRPRSQEVVIP